MTDPNTPNNDPKTRFDRIKKGVKNTPDAAKKLASESRERVRKFVNPGVLDVAEKSGKIIGKCSALITRAEQFELSGNKKKALKIYLSALKKASKNNLPYKQYLEQKVQELKQIIQIEKENAVLDPLIDMVTPEEADKILGIEPEEPENPDPEPEPEIEEESKGFDLFEEIADAAMEEREGKLYENINLFSCLVMLLNNYHHNRKVGQENTLMEKINLDPNSVLEVFRSILSLLRGGLVTQNEIFNIFDQQESIDSWSLLYSHGFLLYNDTDEQTVKSKISELNQVFGKFPELRAFGFPKAIGSKCVANEIIGANLKIKEGMSVNEAMNHPDCDGIPVFEEENPKSIDPIVTKNILKYLGRDLSEDSEESVNDNEPEPPQEPPQEPEPANPDDAINVEFTETDEDNQTDADDASDNDDVDKQNEDADTQLNIQEIINSRELDEELMFLDTLASAFDESADYDADFKDKYFDGKDLVTVIDEINAKMPENFGSILTLVDMTQARVIDEVADKFSVADKDELVAKIREIYGEFKDLYVQLKESNPFWIKRKEDELFEAFNS